MQAGNAEKNYTRGSDLQKCELELASSETRQNSLKITRFGNLTKLKAQNCIRHACLNANHGLSVSHSVFMKTSIIIKYTLLEMESSHAY
jgi:hypothetical protein